MLLLIEAILLIVTTILVRYSERKSYYATSDTFFVSIIMFFVFGVINIGVFTFAGKKVIDSEDVHIPIVSLRTGNEFQGQFALGSGYIGSELYYYFYKKLENNSFQIWHEKAADCIIEEIDNGEPEYYCKYNTYKHSKSLIPLWLHFDIETSNSDRILKVPKGTIIREFKL